MENRKRGTIFAHISLICAFLLIFFWLTYHVISESLYFITTNEIVLSIFLILIWPVAGLIFGIISCKHAKKKMYSIIVIVINSIFLLIVLLGFLFGIAASFAGM